MQSPQQPAYLVIDGIKLGEDDPIDEPRCLGHGVISQGLVELDLRGKKDPRNAFVVLPPSNSLVEPIETGSSLKNQAFTHQLIHSLISHQRFPNKQDQVGSIDSDEFGQRSHQGCVVLHASRRVHQHHVKALVPSWGGREAA